MFDCAEARNLVSRSDEVSLARPFKAGNTGERSSSRRVSDDGVTPIRIVHRIQHHSPAKTPNTLPGMSSYDGVHADFEYRQ